MNPIRSVPCTVSVGLLLLAAVSGCAAKPDQVVMLLNRRALAEAKKPKELATQVHLTAIDGAMKAARKNAENQKRETLRSTSPLDEGTPAPEVVEYPNELHVLDARSTKLYRQENSADAERDALAVAQKALEDKTGLTIPTKSLIVLRKEFEYLSDEAVEALKKSGVETDRGYTVLSVKTTMESIRDVRSEQRLNTATLVAGLVFSVILCGYLYLRIDGFTKGYAPYLVRIPLILSLIAIGMLLYWNLVR